MVQEVRAVPTAAATAAAATAVQVGLQVVVERGGCSAKSRRRAQRH